MEYLALKTLPQLLSDIGGMGGLYVDFSLLSFYVFFETLIINVLFFLFKLQVLLRSLMG